MENKTEEQNRAVAVVITYSFDPEVAVEVFPSYREALLFARESLEEEIRIEVEEKERVPGEDFGVTDELDTEGTATLTNYGAGANDVTTWTVTGSVRQHNAGDNAGKHLFKFNMPIGDWSEDGHGKCAWYLCESNKPVEEVREAHFNIEAATGINIEEICAKYEEDSISYDLYKKLRELGFDEGGDYDWNDDALTEGQVALSPGAMADLWTLLLQKADPGLKLSFCTMPDYQWLPFYGFDAKNRHIGQIGYGMFS